MSVEAFFVLLSALASVLRYGTYFRSIYRRQTRPHMFSWFTWGLVVAIGAYAELKLGGGPSAWGLAFVSFTCFSIAACALFIGEKNIAVSDWLSFLGALLSIVLWRTTHNPMGAVTFLIVVDLLSYWPTIRKSWHNPWGEPAHSYFWAGLRYFLLLFAIPHPTLSTLAYPFWLMATDWAFMLYIVVRQRMLTSNSASLHG